MIYVSLRIYICIFMILCVGDRMCMRSICSQKCWPLSAAETSAMTSVASRVAMSFPEHHVSTRSGNLAASNAHISTQWFESAVLDAWTNFIDSPAQKKNTPPPSLPPQWPAGHRWLQAYYRAVALHGWRRPQKSPQLRAVDASSNLQLGIRQLPLHPHRWHNAHPVDGECPVKVQCKQIHWSDYWRFLFQTAIDQKYQEPTKKVDAEIAQEIWMFVFVSALPANVRRQDGRQADGRQAQDAETRPETSWETRPERQTQHPRQGGYIKKALRTPTVNCLGNKVI